MDCPCTGLFCTLWSVPLSCVHSTIILLSSQKLCRSPEIRKNKSSHLVVFQGYFSFQDHIQVSWNSTSISWCILLLLQRWTWGLLGRALTVNMNLGNIALFTTLSQWQSKTQPLQELELRHQQQLSNDKNKQSPGNQERANRKTTNHRKR